MPANTYVNRDTTGTVRSMVGEVEHVKKTPRRLLSAAFVKTSVIEPRLYESPVFD
jgi:hypothetical protein